MTTTGCKPMDLAEAIEFSHYAARLAEAQPALLADAPATLDAPFDWAAHGRSRPWNKLADPDTRRTAAVCAACGRQVMLKVAAARSDRSR